MSAIVVMPICGNSRFLAVVGRFACWLLFGPRDERFETGNATIFTRNHLLHRQHSTYRHSRYQCSLPG